MNFEKNYIKNIDSRNEHISPELEKKYKTFLNEIKNEKLFLHQLDLKNLLSVLEDGIYSNTKLIDKAGGVDLYRAHYKKLGAEFQESNLNTIYEFLQQLKFLETAKIGDHFQPSIDSETIFSKDEKERLKLHQDYHEEINILSRSHDEEDIKKISDKYKINIKKLKLVIDILPMFQRRNITTGTIGNSRFSQTEDLSIKSDQELNNLKNYYAAIVEQYGNFNPRFAYFMRKEFSKITPSDIKFYSSKYKNLIENYFGYNLVSSTPPQYLKKVYEKWRNKEIDDSTYQDYGQIQIFFDEHIKERQCPLQTRINENLPSNFELETDVGIAGMVTPRHFHAISLGNYDAQNNLLFLREKEKGEITDEYIEKLILKLKQFQQRGGLIMDRERNIPMDIDNVLITFKNISL